MRFLVRGRGQSRSSGRLSCIDFFSKIEIEHDTLWLMGLESGKKPGGSKEDDLERLPLLQGATNRNKIFLDSSGDIFYKLENKKEQEHYKIIDTFRKELEQKGVMFPTLLETRQITSDEGLYVGVTRIPNFHAFDIAEHFGAYTDPDPNPSFIAFLAALDSIATTIPAQHFEEEDEEALSAVLMFVNQAYDLIKEDVENIVGQKELADLFTKSQKYIQDIPRVVQHKDANSSNWRTVKVENKIFVNMLDLETLGVARREWDEGRMYSLLCLDEGKQEIFKNLVLDHAAFEDVSQQIYFWRVVLFRSIRELNLIYTEKYRAPLEQYTNTQGGENIKEDIKKGLLRNIKHSVTELNVRMT